MHGAVPNWKPDPKHVLITPRKDHNFCTMGGTCNCKNYDALYKNYMRIKTEYFKKDARLTELLTAMKSVLEHHLENKLEDWPGHVFDVLLQFACHGQRIPCVHGTCITYHQILEITSVLERLSMELTNDASVKELVTLECFGLLKVNASFCKLEQFIHLIPL